MLYIDLVWIRKQTNLAEGQLWYKQKGTLNTDWIKCHLGNYPALNFLTIMSIVTSLRLFISERSHYVFPVKEIFMPGVQVKITLQKGRYGWNKSHKFSNCWSQLMDTYRFMTCKYQKFQAYLSFLEIHFYRQTNILLIPPHANRGLFLRKQV